MAWECSSTFAWRARRRSLLVDGLERRAHLAAELGDLEKVLDDLDVERVGSEYSCVICKVASVLKLWYRPCQC